jgi:uncharacterized protein with von Willebrand factor type A (vWA) domain
VTGLPEELAAFARVLRGAGVVADASRVVVAAEALDWLGPPGVRELYWGTRLAFCTRAEDIARFNDVFFDRFGAPDGPGEGAADGAGDATAAPKLAGAATGEPGGQGTDAGSAVARAPGGSAHGRAERPAVSLADVDGLAGLMTARSRTRRSLRRSPGARPEVDVARTVEQMLRNGGEPALLRYRHRVPKRRRRLLLLDVSSSMAHHTGALLCFAYAAVQAGPAITEVFALGERLVRLTISLRLRDPAAALGAAAGLTAAAGGGTRLGPTLEEFLRRWGGHSAVRSAVAVVCSDGWEHDNPALLGQQVARLRRLAHHVIWADPLAGRPGFRPIAKGLRLSLPAVDEHLPAGDLPALRAVAASMTAA